MKYVVRAFLVRIHLGALAAAWAIALWSRRPDVLLPLLGAAEVIYLRVLSSRPKFRRWIDTFDAARELERVFATLPREKQARHQCLANECDRLRSLAQVGADGFDRLLAVHVRLLAHERDLERFLELSPEHALAEDLERAERRLSEHPDGDPLHAKAEAFAATAATRAANHRRTREKHDLVCAELERLELELRTLAERGGDALAAEETLAALDLM